MNKGERSRVTLGVFISFVLPIKKGFNAQSRLHRVMRFVYTDKVVCVIDELYSDPFLFINFASYANFASRWRRPASSMVSRTCALFFQQTLKYEIHGNECLKWFSLAMIIKWAGIKFSWLLNHVICQIWFADLFYFSVFSILELSS